MGGQLTKRHTEIFLHNPLFVDVRIPEVGKLTPIGSKLPGVSALAMNCLQVLEILNLILANFYL
jgi:cyclin-dependent kinase-like